MRQIVLDTETTGISPESGHRIIEIGCVELLNRKITGNTFHVYLNPQREVEEGAFQVHGISNEFLADKPLFKKVVADFLNFITGADLIIHNAPFDIGFLHHELKLCNHSHILLGELCHIIDTLDMARKMFPGQRNSLDALCKRFYVDNSHREWHGALLDSELLAKVYLAMTGGQVSLFTDSNDNNSRSNEKIQSFARNFNDILPIIQANADELKEHENYLEFLSKKAGKHYWQD